MCRYIKDDGEQCGREAEPFCHDHEETRFAALWHRTEDVAGQIVPQSSLTGFDPSWTPTVCTECESAVRVVCARIDEAAFKPTHVIPMLALTCACGDSVQYDPEWNSIPKSEVPDKWLFEADR